MDMKQLIEAVAGLTKRVEALEAQKRDRGPKSEQTMTEAHAFAIKFGEDKDLSHKAAAVKHGLSYGQVFSCRGDYTFKHVKKDWKPPVAETAKPADTAPQTAKQ